MASVLVVAEQRGSDPKKNTLEMISAAKGLGADVSAVIIGNGVAGFGEKLGPYGAAKVFVADGVDTFNTQGYTKILAGLIEAEKPDVVLFGASAAGRDLAPRVAAKLGVGLATDCTGLAMDGDKFTVDRPVFAGKAFTKVGFSGSPAIASIRPNVLPVGDAAGGAAEESALDAGFGDVTAKIVEIEATDSGKLDLTEADRIVSGGRGMKSGDNFNILEELADAIGATVGASRAAVDSGYAPQSLQVGQTGKVVNPSLYLAFGISGAIQHLAGMRTSKVIVAVNKDPEAPIFTKADYGIVGDLFEAVPLMTEEFKKLLADG
jgi:electron transfer flavoprotein alpha subunit